MNTCTQQIHLHIVFVENPFRLRYHGNDIYNTILSLFEEGLQWNLNFLISDSQKIQGIPLGKSNL